jgi:hypothetical protein
MHRLPVYGVAECAILFHGKLNVCVDVIQMAQKFLEDLFPMYLDYGSQNATTP